MIHMNDALEMARRKMPDHRFRHCLGVAETARKMADKYGVNPDRAYMAGLLHDYARDKSGEELLQIAGAGGIFIDDIYRRVPDLLHGPAAAILLRSGMMVEDEGILSAISNHTLGQVGMNALDQILFIADMIEPGRNYPGVEALRITAYENLNQAMVCGLDSTINYCLHRGVLLHPRTIKVRNYFLLQMQETGGKMLDK